MLEAGPHSLNLNLCFIFGVAETTTLLKLGYLRPSEECADVLLLGVMRGAAYTAFLASLETSISRLPRGKPTYTHHFLKVLVAVYVGNLDV